VDLLVKVNGLLGRKDDCTAGFDSPTEALFVDEEERQLAGG
jgi:hypothetical protein